MTLDTALCGLSATDMRALIQARDISAVELASAHLERIQACNPQINAIVTLDAERALIAAARADQHQASGAPIGLLHGLPIVHKDCFYTAGMRTTQGSPLFRDHVPDFDSLIVQRERAAGAVTLGKSNVPEFCAGSHTFNTVFGATRNPYAPTRSAGGSSGGSAAALAARMTPLADGSDMGGSLRNPAAFCNVVGLRPSIGRIPHWPQANPFNTLTAIGPMARTVGDVALLLAAIAGTDARDPYSLTDDPRRYAEPLRRDFRGTRIAYCANWGGLPVDDDIRDATDNTLPVFRELGLDVVHRSPDFTGADQAFQTLRGLAFAMSYEQTVTDHGTQVKDAVHWNVAMGLAQTAADIAAAERVRATLHAHLRDFMRDHEFLVGPVTQVSPFPIEQEYPPTVAGVSMDNYIDWMRSCYYLTLTGHPCISVPCGFTPAGLPVGLQIVGRYRDELGLLQLAHAFEQATGVWRQLPDLQGMANLSFR